MKATKLPSGNYRYRIYVGKDRDGKKIWKSFTGPDKDAAKRKAMEYAAGNHRPDSDAFSVALDRYISKQTAVLSPATIRGYSNIRKQLRLNYKQFYSMPIYSITANDVQSLINALISAGKGPKTVRNYYGVVTAVLNDNDARIGRVTLPRKDDKDILIPTEKEIKEIIALTRDTPIEIPVLLAVNGGLRRGEICALTWKDFDFKKNTVSITKDVVYGDDMKWHIKPPKTKAGVRKTPLPPAVMKRIKEIGTLPDLNPRELGHRFLRIMKKAGYTYHIHTMRHFCASYLHSAGVPDAYIMRWLGWENDGVLKRIYRHALDDQEKRFKEIAHSGMDFF